MWLEISIVGLLLLTFSDAQSFRELAVEVHTNLTVIGSIEYTAFTKKPFLKFKSIPYAESPEGKLRFQPSIEFTRNFTVETNASAYQHKCPQITDAYENVQYENCLTLSVNSPLNVRTLSEIQIDTDNLQSYTSINFNKLYPVMVYFHGGGFIKGGSQDYEADYLLESNVVLVIVQYRLGPLGFLSLKNDRIPGNVGILDMILALEWVQKYIQKFGGVSSQVTIFGESAGSVAVSAMLHSPLAQNRSMPLFNRVIMQSGSVFSPKAICDSPIEGALDIAKRAGCTDPTMVEQCLQEVPIRKLLKAFGEHRNEAIIKQGYPSVAGACIVIGGSSGLFPEHPTHYLQNPPKGIAVMAGATSQEGFYLLAELVKLQPELFPSTMPSYQFLPLICNIHRKFGMIRQDDPLKGYQLLSSYLKDNVDQTELNDLIPGLIDICGNHAIKGPLLIDLHAMQTVAPAIYLYSFDFNGRLSKSVPEVLVNAYADAVDHAEELDYLFPRRRQDGRELGMVRVLVQLWTSFATTGTSAADDVPHWPPMDALYGPYLKINDQSEVHTNFLDEFTATQRKFGDNRSG